VKPALALVWLTCSVSCFGQRQIDLKGSIGLASFVDESFDDHLLTGASARIYITRRFSIEPEILYLRENSSHSDLMFTPNLVWDFGGRRMAPYVTGGIGVIRSSDSGFLRSFSNTDAVVSAGGGAKVYLNDGWFVAPEARIGFEAHVRLSVGVGYTWRR
jgi:hypothetical protein